MQATIKSIDSLGNKIDTLNQNLQMFMDKNNGVVIHDTFAPVTTITNIIILVLGGWLTIKWFRKQEKIRTTQEFRIDFLKEYRMLYRDFNKSFKNYNLKVKTIKEVKKWSKIIFEIYQKKEGIDVSGKDELITLIEIGMDVYDKLEILNQHIEDNKRIITIDKTTDYMLVETNIFTMKMDLYELNHALEQLNKGIYENEYLVEKYDKYISRIINSYDKMKELEENLKKAHEKIEDDIFNIISERDKKNRFRRKNI